MKYLLPWEVYPTSILTIDHDWIENFYVRKEFGKQYERESYGEVLVFKTLIGWFTSPYLFLQSFKSAEQAIEVVDEYLNLEFYLIKENEVERFQNKLKLLL